MRYEPPTGWIERFHESSPYGDGRRLRWVFHLDRSCRAVKDADTLADADRPGSASRCRLCAAEA